MLEKCLEDYIKNLDGYEEHPFLESFYQQAGNMSFKLKKADKAKVNFERLVKCKES